MVTPAVEFPQFIDPLLPQRSTGEIPGSSVSIKWTETFVTRPLDPMHITHKFYCQIGRTNVSIHSKGPKILRQYQSEAHLRKEQQ